MSTKTLRIIFEKGLEVGPARNAVTLPAGCNTVAAIWAEVKSRYNVRPVIWTQEWPSKPGYIDLLLLSDASTFLGLALTDMTQVPALHSPSLIVKGINLRYVFGSMLHHCEKLALEYPQICEKFLNQTDVLAASPQFAKQIAETNVSSSEAETAYYEFDALVTAARRAYDATRYILWDVFGTGGGGMPNTFDNAIRACVKMPIALRERLTNSWDQYGRKLKDFRDCIQHCVPLDGFAKAMLHRLEGGVWSAHLKIPDNPEVKSQNKFTFDGGLDALTYGWEITNEIMSMATAITKAIPTK